MRRIFEVIGEVLDSVKGPSSTRMILGVSKFTTHTVRPDVRGEAIDVGIRSRQVVFRTEYRRWWIPNIQRTVYEVVGYAPEEYRDQFNPCLFEPMTYPMLCNRLLKWTEYPHLYAIHAYMDRAIPANLKFEESM